MVLSITVIPVGATGKLSVSVDEAMAQADGTVKVNLRTNNNSGFSALSVRVYYKTDVLTCTSADIYVDTNDNDTSWSAFESTLSKRNGEQATVLSNANDSTISQEKKSAGWSMASYGYTVLKKAFSENGTIGSLTFKVAKDIESCETPIEVEIVKASALDNSTLETENSTSKITINGVTPEINVVSLDTTSVTANGTDDVTVKATATSKKGTDLTNAVIWSVVNENGAGVSIAPNGTITVAKDAMAGDYTIKAAGKTIFSGGGNNTGAPVTGTKKELSTGNATATLKVQRNESQITSVEISGLRDVTIPANSTSDEMQPTATVKDQYGDTMSNQTVSWSLDANNVNGVSINRNTGKVTVTNAAKDSIQESQTFTVTAACGEKTASGTFQVKRADAVTTSITLSDISDMIVPADETNATENVTPTVKDQYNTQISNPTVAWSIAPKVTGVSIDNNGKITVTNAAKAGITNTTGTKFTVTATSGTATAEKEFYVKRDTQTAKALVICKNGVELSGDTDTVIIPTTDTANDYTYTVKISDQYGAEMTAASTVTISAIGDADTGAINSNKLTISKTATKDKKYKVTATCGTLTKEVTVTVKDIDITWPTVSKAAGTYGDKWSDIVKYSGGSAVLNGTNVEGTFAIKNADDVPDVSEYYQFVFKSTDGKYTVESPAYGAELRKKALTITAASASKRYDGTALTKNEYTANGLVNNDTIDSVTVTGTVTNVADTATNNTASNAVIKHGDAVKTANYDITYVPGTLTITKATLTIKAKDKTITYGEEPANDGVTYTGLANGEDGATVVTGLTYEYNYQQFGNVGEYVITPKGATAANYDITYQPGKLTVNQKEVGLTWSGAENLYYNGQAKNVTATATGPLNGDVIAVTVTGGKETAVGNYTAKATALTGEKAGNYALPTDVTKTYQIQSALDASALTVTPNTVTATIDGLTIKLVGYASTNVTVSATGATVDGDKLTIHGVDYTIDRTGVKSIGDKVTVANSDVSVVLPTNASNELKAVNNDATTVSGLNNALADLLAKAGENLPEGATKVEVKAILRIKPVSYEAGKSLKLNIKPEIQYTYKNASDAQVGEIKTLPVDNSDIKAPVTISVYLPDSFAPNFAKHGSEWLKVKTESGVATWQQSSFSEVELVKDDRSATVNFTFEDGHAQSITYGPADIGKAFPTDSKDGYTFNGWTISGKTYTTLTDEALTDLSGTTVQNAKASFTQKSNNGGNHGGSGGSGVSTYPVSVTTPKNGKVSVDPRNAAKGAAVTVTVTPDSGYEMDKLTVTDASGKTISTTDKGNGKFTFTMPNGKVSVSATFKQTTVTPPSTGFVDVPASAYYADAVKWAVEKGITTGTSATTFSPEASCTRAQMVTFLWRAAGSPAPKATTTAFTDLDKSAYYYDAVLWAVEQGITTGTSATTFSPNATVTRGQTVTFLYRFAGQPAVSGSSSFTDVNSSDYYAAAVQWAKEQGITSGTSATTFSPTNDCTRGQIVTFLYRQLAK